MRCCVAILATTLVFLLVRRAVLTAVPLAWTYADRLRRKRSGLHRRCRNRSHYTHDGARGYHRDVDTDVRWPHAGGSGH